LVLKHYKVGNKLGSGAFAVVRMATSRANKRPYAIKFISKVSSRLKLFPPGGEQHLAF